MCVLELLTGSTVIHNNPQVIMEESLSVKQLGLDSLALSTEIVKEGKKLAWYVSISSICSSD